MPSAPTSTLTRVTCPGDGRPDGREHHEVRDSGRRAPGRHAPLRIPGPAGPGAGQGPRAVRRVRRPGCLVRGTRPARGARPGAHRSPSSARGLTMVSVARHAGRGMIADRRPRAGSGAVAGGIAGPGPGGVVPRPELCERLGGAARVTVVSGPPGSGKTVLLRSWITQDGLGDRAAWLPAGRDGWDPQRFWLSAVGALRRTMPGSALVEPLTAAPDLDGWRIVERLLTDLAPLADRIWLVVDDLHELGPEGLGQLELLIMRAPPSMGFVLATRHDVRLGLHRLRLEGKLTELRADDLRFPGAEARALFAAAGMNLPEAAVVTLRERTEGWAAGLRLASLSLAGHPDPARFAAEFSGTE